MTQQAFHHILLSVAARAALQQRKHVYGKWHDGVTDVVDLHPPACCQTYNSCGMRVGLFVSGLPAQIVCMQVCNQDQTPTSFNGGNTHITSAVMRSQPPCLSCDIVCLSLCACRECEESAYAGRMTTSAKLACMWSCQSPTTMCMQASYVLHIRAQLFAIAMQ